MKTTIKNKYYVIAFIVSILFIVASFVNNHCEKFINFILLFVSEFIDITASGLFPAILVAYFTDIVNTNHKINEYNKKLQCKKKELEEIFLDLPSEILVSINTPNYTESGKKTFLQWCEFYFSDKKYRQFRRKEFTANIDYAKTKVEQYIGFYKEYQSNILEDLRQRELAKAKEVRRLLVVCNRFNEDIGQYISDLKDLVNSICDFFDDTEEFKEIHFYFKEKYNSDNFCV